MALSINRGDINFLKVALAVKSEGGRFLDVVFGACYQGNTQTLKDYFTSRYSNTQLGKFFNKPQRNALDDGTPFESVDISFKYAIVQRACGFPPPDDPAWTRVDHSSLFYNLYLIKELRNLLAHEKRDFTDEAVLNQTFSNLKSYITDGVAAFKSLQLGLGRSVSYIDQTGQEIQQNLGRLQNQDIVGDDVVGHVQNLLKTDGTQENCSNLERVRMIYPLPSTLWRLEFLVKNIYVPIGLEFDESSRPRNNRSFPIEVKELLTKKVPLAGVDVLPQVVTIVGPNGSGKSTIFAHLASECLEKQSDIAGLLDFDLVIHISCKQASCKTFSDLLRSCMPTAVCNISDNLLHRAALQMKLLILVDGFDEASSETKDLLKNLFENMRNLNNIRILLTTRPGSKNDAMRLMKELKCLHLKVSELTNTQQREVIKNYYNAFKGCGTNPPPVEHIFEMARGHNEPIPLSMTLFTYLACVAPDRIRPSMPLIQLLEEISDILKEKLHDRLVNEKKTMYLSEDEREDKIQCFMQELNDAALQCVVLETLELPHKILTRIVNKCRNLELPQKEMFEAFLSSKQAWMPTGTKLMYNFPHTSQLEYRGALGLCQRLFSLQGGGQELSLREILQAQDGRLARLWDMLLMAVWTFQRSGLLSDYAKELAQLMRSSHEEKGLPGDRVDAYLEAMSHSGMHLAFVKHLQPALPRTMWRVSKCPETLLAVESEVFPNTLNIRLMRCPRDVTGLEDILNKVKGIRCCVVLNLYNCLLNAATCYRQGCGKIFTHLTTPGNVCKTPLLWGPFNSDVTFPKSILGLVLSIHTPHDMIAFQKQVQNSLKLKGLGVCVPVRYDEDMPVPPLTKEIKEMYLIIQGAREEDIDWTIQFFTNFHVSKKYKYLFLRDTTVNVTAYEKMVTTLAENGVKVADQVILDGENLENISSEDKQRLTELTVRLLGCTGPLPLYWLSGRLADQRDQNDEDAIERAHLLQEMLSSPEIKTLLTNPVVAMMIQSSQSTDLSSLIPFIFNSREMKALMPTEADRQLLSKLSKEEFKEIVDSLLAMVKDGVGKD
ncbi:uncharacterized protein LOC143032746 [Oratosquilla oratoria]|uniref:uncharacterized protein LOC143032746 n=1 Tax=Oratosquilla oratoria TaxID=337810 RepID=UPI003F76022E